MAAMRRQGRSSAGRPAILLGFRRTSLPDAPTPDVNDPSVAAELHAGVTVTDILDEPWIRVRRAQMVAELTRAHREDEALVEAHHRADLADLELLHIQTSTTRTPPPTPRVGDGPEPSYRVRERAKAVVAAQTHASALAACQEARNLEAVRLTQAADDVARRLEAIAAAFVVELENYRRLANTAREATSSPPLPVLPDGMADELVREAMTRPDPPNPRRTR